MDIELSGLGHAVQSEYRFTLVDGEPDTVAIELESAAGNREILRLVFDGPDEWRTTMTSDPNYTLIGVRD